MVEELAVRLVIEAAALLAGAALAQLLRWLAARFGIGALEAGGLPSELAGAVLRAF
jgi:hypothetical protein